MKKRTYNNPAMGLTASPTPSIIGSDVEIIGNVKTTGELQLEGKIQGDLNCGCLVMGETGSVKGTITADNITIRGHVNGEIRSKTVRLESTAIVEGNVFHENLSVESGARLTGQFAHTSDLTLTKVEKPVADNAAPSFLKTNKDAAE